MCFICRTSMPPSSLLVRVWRTNHAKSACSSAPNVKVLAVRPDNATTDAFAQPTPMDGDPSLLSGVGVTLGRLLHQLQSRSYNYRTERFATQYVLTVDQASSLRHIIYAHPRTIQFVISLGRANKKYMLRRPSSFTDSRFAKMRPVDN